LRPSTLVETFCGAIAQLGERNTGSVEVGGSIPPSSTKTSSRDALAVRPLSITHSVCDGSLQGSGNRNANTKGDLDSAVQAALEPSDKLIAEVVGEGALRN
jgi:hypothetical protein